MKYSSITIFILSICLFTCQSKKEDLGLAENLADFEEFYFKFHEDSLYQMNHIIFPLQGIPDNVINKPDYNDQFQWDADNWTLNRPIDLEKTGFTRSFTTMGDRMVTEELRHKSAQYGMVRRFAKIDGEWTLIYYQGINPIQQ